MSPGALGISMLTVKELRAGIYLLKFLAAVMTSYI